MKIIAQERFLVAPEPASDVYHPATVLAGRFLEDDPTLLLNGWYLDDGHVVGKSVDLIRCLQIIEEWEPEHGIILNLIKCEVYGIDTYNFPIEIKRASEGLTVLGSPIGSREFVASKVNDIVCLKSRESSNGDVAVKMLLGYPKGYVLAMDM
jgi:hypothetical protein